MRQASENNHAKKTNLTRDLEDLVAVSEDYGWKKDEETSGKNHKTSHDTLTKTTNANEGEGRLSIHLT